MKPHPTPQATRWRPDSRLLWLAGVGVFALTCRIAATRMQRVVPDRKRKPRP